MVSEKVELRGHIIDSLILPKVLDAILTHGGNFKIDEIRIGQNRIDQSYARIEVSAGSPATLDDLVLRLRQHGAEVMEKTDAQLVAAPADGVFPADFYVTTNQQTFVRVNGKEIEVAPTLMNAGIAVDGKGARGRAVKFYELRRGDQIVVGHHGIKVAPLQRETSHTDVFEFIDGSVSIERPKSVLIQEIAREMQRVREKKGKILVVAGSAVVQTGAGEHLEKLIEWGYVNLLFGGNALAVSDIASVLYEKMRRANPDRISLHAHQQETQLRAINTVRAAGGMASAVKKKVLPRGLMYGCVQHGVDVVLAGSIRDEGPLPEVITDSIVAQQTMREKLQDVSMALMLSTMLHSMSVGALLPAQVKTVCVDINPGAISKLVDRGSFQALGLVTDIEPFLRELTGCLETLRAPAKKRGASA